VFSAEQLVIDCEIKDHVTRMLEGLDGECDPDACVRDVMAGIEHGFMGLDSSAENYRRLYWHPPLFERRFLGAWQEAGGPDIREQARAEVRRLVVSHEFRLPAELQREIDRIYSRAERELGR